MTTAIRRVRRFLCSTVHFALFPIVLFPIAAARVVRAQQSVTSGEFVLARGADTAVERFQRDARRLNGDTRVSDGSRFQYVARLQSDASIASLDAILTAKDSTRSSIIGSFERPRL